jgi:hypothetical protein
MPDSSGNFKGALTTLPGDDASKVEWALYWARFGIPVSPAYGTDADGRCDCGKSDDHPRGKHPFTRHGHNDATTDACQIRAWWSEYPNANIIGAIGAGGFVALDLDRRDGKDGFEALGDLEMESGRVMSPTLTFETASGNSQHLLYRGATASRNAFRPGFDVKSVGGYIILPGSSIGASLYRVLHNRALADCPSWFSVLIGRPRERDASNESVGALDQPHNIERASEWLERRAPAVQGEGGDSHTYATACGVIDFGIGEAVCLDLMLEHYNERCVPPWIESELAKKVESAWRNRQTKPGSKASDSAALDEAMERALSADGSFETSVRPSPTKDSLLPLYREHELDAIPEPEWLIEDIAGKNELVYFFGDTGNLKSFLEVRAAVCGASGIAFGSSVNSPEIQKHKIPKKFSTVILAGEGQSGLSKRIKACKRHLGITGKLPVAIVPELEALTDPAKLQRLIDTILAKFGRPDAVWIDTSARAGVGIDIFHPGQATILETAFRTLMRALGCSVFVIAHTGKDRSRGIVGARQQHGNADRIFQAEFHKGQGAGRGTLHLINEKARDEEDGGATYFRVSIFTLDPGSIADAQAGAPARKPITSLVLDCIESNALPQPANDTGAGYIDVAVSIIRERVDTAPEPAGPLAARVAERMSAGWDSLPAGEAERITRIIQDQITRAASRDSRLSPYAWKDGGAKTAAWLFGVRPRSKRQVH